MNDAKKIIKKVELMRHNSQEHETYRNLPLAKECMLLLESLDDPEEGPLGKAYACNAILEQLSEYDTPRFCMEILQREKQWVEESEEKSDWLTPESIDSDILRLEDYIDTEGISMQDFCKKHGKHLLFDPVERTPQWEEIYLEVEKMSDFIIRKIELKDAGELCKICSEEMGYECDPALVKSKIEKLDSKREAVFVAEEESQLLGFIHVERYEVLDFESMANILGLAVKKDFQKQGLGKALLLAAENWAQENGIYLMRLNSGINRTDAHGFYEHLGYVSEKEQKRFVKNLK